jgi:hypothetical protein
LRSCQRAFAMVGLLQVLSWRAASYRYMAA